MELRNIGDELDELKKRINNNHLSKTDLLVLNLLPMTTDEKVELFRACFAEAQREKANEAKVLHVDHPASHVVVSDLRSKLTVADPLPPLPPKLKREKSVLRSD